MNICINETGTLFDLQATTLEARVVGGAPEPDLFDEMRNGQAHRAPADSARYSVTGSGRLLSSVELEHGRSHHQALGSSECPHVLGYFQDVPGGWGSFDDVQAD